MFHKNDYMPNKTTQKKIHDYKKLTQARPFRDFEGWYDETEAIGTKGGPEQSS